MPPSIPAAIAGIVQQGDRFVLAVSGGLDSMVLLDAAAREIEASRLVVATFDHGTGRAASAAGALVQEEGTRRRLRVVAGRADSLPATEAAWRDARWRFLRDVAAATGARIVTAHTEDDQVETVLMRALRDAGARGLAGLLAPGDVLRPFVTVPRATLERYARARGIRWAEDPSNADLRFLRNRVRHQLLPALLRVRPALRGELLAVARDAARWRREMDALAVATCPTWAGDHDRVVVAAADLVGYDAASLAVLWSSIAARAGLALDRRGTRRLAAFTNGSVPGGGMPLAGGWEVVRSSDAFELRRTTGPAPDAHLLPLSGALRWGRWSFIPDGLPRPGDAWSAELPAGTRLLVRGWAATDRVRHGTGAVRVKRLLAEAGVPAAERAGWPVVVAGRQIVWVPGVSRALAATARSGRPGVRIRCERSD